MGNVLAPNNLGLHGMVLSVTNPILGIGLGLTADFLSIRIINFAFTGTEHSGGARTMAEVFAMEGAPVIGSASFSEAAIPEPASVALLGIGLSGLLAFCRRLVK